MWGFFLSLDPYFLLRMYLVRKYFGWFPVLLNITWYLCFILADAEMENNGVDQEQFEDADKWPHIIIARQHFSITQEHIQTEDILSIKIEGRLICDAWLLVSNILGPFPKM